MIAAACLVNSPKIYRHVNQTNRQIFRRMLSQRHSGQSILGTNIWTRYPSTAMSIEHTRRILVEKRAFIVDCDGVLYHGDHLLPGAKEFLSYIQSTQKKYLFLTNSSDKTPEMLAEKFLRLGLEVEAKHFYTSAMSTATFLGNQRPGGTAFMIGEQALRSQLKAEGINVITRDEAEVNTPDFVVVGETVSDEKYNFQQIESAVRFVRRGARLIGTNEDHCDQLGNELLPGVGSLILPIQACSGYDAYFLGKPNPLMVSSATERLGCSRSETLLVGDRMNTDVRSGVEAGVDTLLVLSGVTRKEDIAKFAYRPRVVLDSVGDIEVLCKHYAHSASRVHH